MGFNIDKYREFSPVVLRLGLALVFFWFAYSQFSSPDSWARLIPSWTSIISSNPETIVLMNAFFEIALGIFLVLGFYTRTVSALTTLHLAQITFTVVGGFSSPVGIRDLGLTIAALAIFLNGADKYSLDYRRKKNNPN